MPETNLNELQHDDKQELNIFNMFTRPNKEFEKLKGPHSLVKPIIILAALIALSTFALTLVISEENITPMSGVVAFGVLFSFIGVVIGFLFAALILWGITYIFGGEIRFKQALSIHVLTTIIGVLGGIVNTVIVVIFNLDVERQYTGLGALVSQEEPIWALFSTIDVFSIWTGVLVAFGVKTITSLSWAKSIIIVVLTILIPAAFSYFVNALLAGMAV